MRRVSALLGLLILLAVPAAQAQSPDVALRLTYRTYAAGFTTVALTVGTDLGAGGYRLSLDYHTLGMIGLLFPGHAAVSAAGLWESDTARPHKFESEGTWSGRRYDVLIDYSDGTPLLRRITPSQANRREPVPTALREGTIDTVSAMALLLHRMADGEGCDLGIRVFDGRRLMALQSSPAGTEELGVTARSFFHGPAMRCDVTGKTLAGFLRSDDAAERQRMSHGSVWFAHPVQGMPLLPVRMAFRTRWFGMATMYLTNVESAAPADVSPLSSEMAQAPAGPAHRKASADR